MRELSIQINVYPIAKMRQDIYRFTADEFTFAPVPEDSEAGRCFNCNKDITVDLPPVDVIRDFSSANLLSLNSGIPGTGSSTSETIRYRPSSPFPRI